MSERNARGKALTPTEVPPEKQMADAADIAAASPAAFAFVTGQNKWLPFEHLLLMDEYIMKVAAGDIDRLIISSSVRHGKSELVSHHLPAWWLGRNPDDQIILASYEAKFAASWGRKARDTLNEYGPQVFGVSVAESPAAADWWYVKDHHGVMVCAGMRGGITGKGANLLIIDDPIKDAEQASSAVYRQKVWDWWQATASSRLQPNGKVIVIMARWHEDDLVGRLQTEQGDRWTILNIPAIAEENDPMHRKVGEALCPEMYDIKALNAKKKELGQYWFASLYQQKPSPAEGLLFKRRNFRYWSKLETNDILFYILRDGDNTRRYDAGYLTLFQTVDVAGSESKKADWTVVATWGLTPNKDLLLLEVVRQKFQTKEVTQFLKDQNDKHNGIPMWIETFGAGAVPYKELQEDGYPVRTLKAEQGTQQKKWIRAQAAAATYERHAVFHPLEASWLGDYEEELVSFNTGTYDDQVDVTSYATKLLPTMGVKELPKERPKAVDRKPLLAGVKEMVW